jgi:low temperature requirement protein LtrA
MSHSSPPATVGPFSFRLRSSGFSESDAASYAAGGDARLFFDLVFVFAITQVSHVILDHGVTWEYAGQAALCLLVVWWAWNYTTLGHERATTALATSSQST